MEAARGSRRPDQETAGPRRPQEAPGASRRPPRRLRGGFWGTRRYVGARFSEDVSGETAIL
eukprot:7017954-Pyramimonas_sp.AAC.1